MTEDTPVLSPQGKNMTSKNDIYRAIRDIYDSCLPALGRWCAEHGYVRRELEIACQPEIASDEIAFLCVFAVLKL